MSKRSMLRIAPVVLGLGLSMAVGVPHAVANEVARGNSMAEERGNNENTRYEFLMRSTGNTSGTGFRPKLDSTSVYVRVDYSRGEPRIFVDGAMGSGTSIRDCTATAYRVRDINGDIHRRMRNFVNEWGYESARITTWADRNPSEVRGWWSPDSNPNGGYTEMPSA